MREFQNPRTEKVARTSAVVGVVVAGARNFCHFLSDLFSSVELPTSSHSDVFQKFELISKIKFIFHLRPEFPKFVLKMLSLHRSSTAINAPWFARAPETAPGTPGIRVDLSSRRSLSSPDEEELMIEEEAENAYFQPEVRPEISFRNRYPPVFKKRSSVAGNASKNLSCKPLNNSRVVNDLDLPLGKSLPHFQPDEMRVN